MIEVVEVGAGAAIGGPARYVVDQVVNSKTGGAFPWGTYVINATGAFLLGLLAGMTLYHGMSDVASLIIGTGFCGAFTTFSTFAWETVRLAEDGTSVAGLYNVVGSLAAGLLLAAAGLGLAGVV